MTEIVIVKGSDVQKKFKPTGETLLTKDLKDEIKELLNGSDTYVIARMGILEILEIDQEPEEDDDGNPVELEPMFHEPTEDGYYLQGTVSYEFIEPGFFGKMRIVEDLVTTGEGEDLKTEIVPRKAFFDLSTGKEISL